MAKNIISKIVKGEVKEATEELEWQTQMPDNPDDEFADLIDTIHKGYVANNEPKFMQKKTFSPSTIVFGHGKCPRYWYLAFEGNTFYEEREGKSQANMESGTDRHKRIQDAMQASGIMVANEEKVTFDDPPIFGYLDSIISWKDTEYLVEIKTANQDSFERHKKTMTASTYHIVQLLIYMKIFKKKKGIVMYENKNTHDLLAIPINITQSHVDFVDYLFDWMKEVYAAWKDKKLPEVPYKSNTIKTPCSSCPVQQACQSAPKGDIKIARRKEEKGEF
jgi:CRISPR/Cas system-associated exonuclease Cas4 (RecB family)